MRREQVEETVSVAVDLIGMLKKGQRSASPRWKQEAERLVHYALVTGFLFLASAFLLQHLSYFRISMAAALTGLSLVILSIVPTFVSIFPHTTFRRALILNVANGYDATDGAAAEAHRRVPYAEVWRWAAQALDDSLHRTKLQQTWAGIVLATGLTIFIATNTGSVLVCELTTPFDIYKAFRNEFPYSLELCKFRAYAGGFLVSMVLVVMGLQRRIFSMANAYEIARGAVNKYGSRS